jgi:hypothetical protein
VQCSCILIVVSTTTNIVTYISVVYDELTLQCVSGELYQGLIKTETITEKVMCVLNLSITFARLSKACFDPEREIFKSDGLIYNYCG